MYLASKLDFNRKTMISSTIDIKQTHIHHKQESKLIKYQTIVSFESISEKILRMSSPIEAQFNFA